MIIKKRSAVTAASNRMRRIVADDEDDMQLDDSAIDMLDDDGFDSSDDEAIDDIADAVDDLQDSVDDVVQDDEQIEVENNIEDHYIAECDRCKGIFISAVKESDEPMEYVHGTCPLCGEETDQTLKWVVRAV